MVRPSYTKWVPVDAFLERFFLLSKDLLVIGTPEGLPVKMSPSWSTVLGWSLEELKTIKAQELIHPEDLALTIEVVSKSIQGEAIFSFENRYRHKSGTYKSLIWNGVFSKEDNLFYAIARDLSDYFRIEDRLKLSERRLKVAQKIAKIGSWDLELHSLVDMDVNTLNWSDQVFRIFGYEPGAIEVSNENFFKGVHPDDREKVKFAVQEALQSGKDYDIEHRICLPDGTEKIVHELSEVIVDEQTGKAVSMAGTVQDITEQKKLLHQLVGAQKMESIGRLAGGIAHDFNNLLAAILGNIEVMQREISPESKSYRNLKNIEATAKRAADLTNQLLAFSRQQVLTPVVQDLNALVVEASKMLSRLIGADIEMDLSLEPDLGFVEVDSSQVIQIILNLAINARDAMPSGGHLSIETSQVLVTQKDPLRTYIKSGNYAQLKVADTGLGMSPEVLEKIFEPFFTTKQEGRGTGLGLATVYGIVKQSSGFVSAESEVGKGTAFKVLFPITTKSCPVVEPSKPQVSSPVTQGQGQLILLVEDEKELQEILAEVLTDSGYRVLVASTGKEGFELFSQHSHEIHLLITDVIMPGMNGFDLIKKTKELKATLPIICVSGHSSKDLRASVDVSNLTFVQKPFSFSQILEKIEKLLNQTKE